MSVGSVVGGIIGGRARNRGRAALGFAALATGFRLFRRMTRHSSKPVLRFAVKPGEVYEIRGLRRGK